MNWLPIPVAALLISLSVTGLAGEDHLNARRLVESGSIQPLESILESIQAERPGRILEVELEREHGQYRYMIELLDQSGLVWELELDAVTGKTLKRSLEE